MAEGIRRELPQIRPPARISLKPGLRTKRSPSAAQIDPNAYSPKHGAKGRSRADLTNAADCKNVRLLKALRPIQAAYHGVMRPPYPSRRDVLIGLATCAAHPLLADVAIPNLGSGIGSASFELVRISNPYSADLTVAGDGRFYVSADSHWRRIRPTGIEDFALERQGDDYRVPFSPFVLSADAVLDMSMEPPEWVPVTQRINAFHDRALTAGSFADVLARAYDQADVMVVGQYDDTLDRQRVYFRVDGAWVLFFMSHRDIDIEHDWVTGFSIAGYPTKHSRMYHLADPTGMHLAHPEREVRDKVRRLPEHDMTYPTDIRLIREDFDVKYVSEHLAYTNIPILMGGLASYRIDVGGEVLRFRERATRHVMGISVKTGLQLYRAPALVASNPPLAFLAFLPGNNVDTLGGDGLYVLRPRA